MIHFNKRVSILILMDYQFLQKVSTIITTRRNVSILILMDYQFLLISEGYKWVDIWSFNPYFNGLSILTVLQIK